MTPEVQRLVEAAEAAVHEPGSNVSKAGKLAVRQAVKAIQRQEGESVNTVSLREWAEMAARAEVAEESVRNLSMMVKDDKCVECRGDISALSSIICRPCVDVKIGALMQRAEAILTECQWTRAGMGWMVESRSGRDIGVAHMRRDLCDALAAVKSWKRVDDDPVQQLVNALDKFNADGPSPDTDWGNVLTALAAVKESRK
jgi:hypothetical protein